LDISMKKTKLYLLVGLFTFGPLSASANSLLDIYELALKNDAQLKADTAAYEAGQELRGLNRAGLLPLITAGANYTENDRDRTDNLSGTVGTIDTTQTGWGVSLEQPLFNMASWYTYKQGVKLSEQAEAQFGADQQSLIVRVAQAYFNVLRAVDTLEATVAEENALSHQLEQTRQRFDVGLTAITEVHEAQAAFDSATAATLEARGNLNINFEALEVLTGQSHEQIAPLAPQFPVVEPVPSDRHEWVQFSLKNNYALKASKLNAEAADQVAKAARSGHLPTVRASLAYNESNDEGINQIGEYDEDLEGTSIGVNLTVPIFSGGGTSSRRRQAYAQATQAQELFNNTQRSIIQSTRALHLSVETGVARVQARKQAIVSSQSALEATQSGYEVGTRNLVEVLQAQRQLYQARRDYATALYDYIINTIQLREVAGMLTPADVQEVDKWLQDNAPVNRSQYNL
jgi:outer membrane protein